MARKTVRCSNQQAFSQAVLLNGVGQILRPADVLLIVPPFASLSYPSFAVHLLQACGGEAGFRVQVLYASILMASVIGEKAYNDICEAPLGSFAGERLFARCAYGMPALGRHADRMFEPSWVVAADEGPEIDPVLAREQPIGLRELKNIETLADGFIESLATAIGEASYRIVGCTSSFEQTTAAVALLNRIKHHNKATVTILGGANCEGEMARGIVSLAANIDYVFSGESETTFVNFVRAILAGMPPMDCIIQGQPCSILDDLPTPLFNDFYEQRNRFLPQSPIAYQDTVIPYESSRGCWWGQKQHCTFCGLNAYGMTFRQKTPDRVIEEIRLLLAAHPTRRIMMTDNIMPHGYFVTLLPRLTAELPDHSIFYEQRSNLSLTKVLALKHAGIDWIQAGIEALSSRLLKLVRKGVEARQNLMLLRYARAAGLRLSWNLLWGFPADDVQSYLETLAIVPLLHHLPPPDRFAHVVIERFSPYFSRPTDFGLHRVKPISGYYDFLPKTADVRRLTYDFTAEYKCGAHKRIDVIRQLSHELRQWHAAWPDTGGEPLENLRISQDRERYVLEDTRRAAGKTGKTYVLDQEQAWSLTVSRPYSPGEFESWAVAQKLAVVVDGWFVPLPVADPGILLLMEQRQTAKTIPPPVAT